MTYFQSNFNGWLNFKIIAQKSKPTRIGGILILLDLISLTLDSSPTDWQTSSGTSVMVEGFLIEQGFVTNEGRGVCKQEIGKKINRQYRLSVRCFSF